MTPAVSLLAACAASYLVGSIPTAYLAVRWLKRVDVRTVGSGNVGATNVTRAAGLGPGIAVFLVDLGKGLAAVLVLAPWLVAPEVLTPAVRLACGLWAVLGHAFPVFLRFQGGKGVATTIGVLLGTMPPVAGICLAVWVFGFALSRYVSVGSLAAAAALPVVQLLMRQTLSEIVLGTALGALIIARHQANIARLAQGTEHRAPGPPGTRAGAGGRRKSS